VAIIQLGTVDPQEAIQQLTTRLRNPVESYSWLDVWQAMHARQFTVAKSAGYDILGDIVAALDAALKNGTTFEDFTRNLIPLLQDKGWWGKALVRDPLTGEMTTAQLGSLRRLQTIYDTNMRVAFNAGRWAQAQRVKLDRPYLRYLHTASEHPRHSHLQWVGITLPVEHPWWQTHMPPNGWGCKCSAVSLSERQFSLMRDAGQIRDQAPVTTWRQFLNKRTGQAIAVPDGIDPGWGYNVGEAFLQALAAA
jgi:uncharacterized protein with gpF-like domain